MNQGLLIRWVIMYAGHYLTASYKWSMDIQEAYLFTDESDANVRAYRIGAVVVKITLHLADE